MSAKRTTDPAGRPGKEVKNMDNEKEKTPGAGGKNAPKSGEEKNNKNLVRILSAVLLVLLIVVILLLLRSCQGQSPAGPSKVLEPDYPQMTEDPNADTIPDDDSEKPVVSNGGGSVTISFMDNVTYSLSTGELSLYYQNPNASTHNVVVQVILENGEDESLLAQSGILTPGHQVTALQADAGAPQLSVGGYNGKLKLLFYDPETGERAIVDTDIPCTVSVVE